ncbi:GNAT family N-acetyltransferase [bacterium]|nr:GNAT family N-acetyltransferase [bacterium]
MPASQPAFEVQPAQDSDHAAILELMAHWNMQHVPSVEVEELYLPGFNLVRSPAAVGALIAACGHKLLAPGRGKNTLFAVHPQWRGRGLGHLLMDRALQALRAAGARTVLTNTDRPESVAWYSACYGYRVIGRLPKLMDFGVSAIPFWTTMELDLDARFAGRPMDPLPADAPPREELPSYAGLSEHEAWDGAVDVRPA